MVPLTRGTRCQKWPFPKILLGYWSKRRLHLLVILWQVACLLRIALCWKELGLWDRYRAGLGRKLQVTQSRGLSVACLSCKPVFQVLGPKEVGCQLAPFPEVLFLLCMFVTLWLTLPNSVSPHCCLFRHLLGATARNFTSFNYICIGGVFLNILFCGFGRLWFWEKLKSICCSWPLSPLYLFGP